MKTIHAQGKRKKAIARATIKPGKGHITVNGIEINTFGSEMFRLRILEPIILAGNTIQSLDIAITCCGGGLNGQADAIRVAIARALVEHDSKLETVFDDYDRMLLVADVRRNEACKPNDSKPRAKRQKSYR